VEYVRCLLMAVVLIVRYREFSCIDSFRRLFWMSNVEDGDAEEQTRQIWRKNVPYLYDVMMTKELAWPTLTVEWLPERRYDADKECNVHRLLIGTHTGGEETNHVIVAEVYLPPQPERLNMKLYDSATEEVGGYNRTDACVALKAETGADGKIYDKR